MALQKQTVGIDFTQGLDKHADDRLATKLVTLDNGVFDDRNTIQKAGGYTAVTVTNRVGSAIAATVRSLSTRNNELLIEDNDTLHSVITGGTGGLAAGTFQRESNVYRCSAEVQNLVEGFGDVFLIDFADAGASAKTSCWAWVNGSGASAGLLNYALVSEATGGVVFAGTCATVGVVEALKVVWDSTNSVFRLFTVESSQELAHYNVNPALPGDAPVRTQIFADAATTAGLGPVLDAVFSGSSTYLVYKLITTGYFRVAKLSATTVSNYQNSTRAITAASVNLFGSGEVGVATTFNSAVPGLDEVYAWSFTGDLVSTTGSVAIETANSNAPGRITVYPNTTSTKMNVLWQDTSATAMSVRLRTAVVTSVPAVDTAAVTLIRGMGIASKMFRQNSKHFFLANLQNDLQSTLYVVGFEGSAVSSASASTGVIARVLPSKAGRYTSAGTLSWSALYHLPNVVAHYSESEAFVVPVLSRSELLLVNGSDVSKSLGTRCTLRFGRTVRPLQSLEIEDWTLFAGASSFLYDGLSYYEAGFHAAPDSATFSLAVSNGSGSKSNNAAYGVALVWEFTDASGRTWQSEPVYETVNTGASDDTITVTAATDKLTRRRLMAAAGQTPVVSEILVAYCTEGDGSIYYREATATNDPTANTVSISLETADSTLINNPVLYTTGGVVVNNPLPGCRLLCHHQNRVFFAGGEDPYAIHFSSELRSGKGLEFSEEVDPLRVPDRGGVVTALASMDDKLVVFCERCIWVYSGSGPSRTGLNDTFSEPFLAVPDLGCKMASPDSVVLTPHGLWFRSDVGLRLLTRQLQIAAGEGVLAGAEVDSLVDGCVAAFPVPGKNLVRFYTGTVVLVFDYQHGQWSRLTNHACVAARLWQNNPVHITSAAVLYQAGGSTHAGTAIALTVETGWLHFGGIQGYQRIYELLILGQFQATSTLTVRTAHDYQDYSEPAVDISTGSIASATVPVQVRYRPRTQKCQAMRVKISESGGTGAGFGLTNLSATVGVKQGAAKLARVRNLK